MTTSAFFVEPAHLVRDQTEARRFAPNEIAPELHGRFSVRYRGGGVELIDGVDLEKWNRIKADLETKGFTEGFVAVMNHGSVTIINLVEVARISWIIDRGKAQS